MDPKRPDNIDLTLRRPNVIRSEDISVMPGYGTVDRREYFLENLWRILLNRRWTILASTAIVLTLASIATFKSKPLYESVCRIAISKQSNVELGLKDGGQSSDDAWDYGIELETQTKILQSDALALQVIRDNDLEKNPSFVGAKAAAAAAASSNSIVGSENNSAEQAAMLANFRSGLRVTPVPRTRIIEIRYQSRDPKLAAIIANGLAKAFIEQNFRTKFESTMQASEWLSKQLSDLKLKVETSQEKLVRYQKEHNILGIDEKQNIITSKLDELNRQVTNAETERIQKEASWRLASSGNPELMARTESTSTMEKFRLDRAALQSKYIEASTTFGPSYPKVQELKNQLDAVDRDIQGESQKIGQRLQNEYLAALQREKMLGSALEQQKQTANQLNESAIEYNVIKRDLESSRQLYEGLLQHLKEAGVTAGLKSTNIRIVDSARVPISPSSPNVPRNIAAGFLIGLLGGLGLAFLQESMDNTVRTPDQIEAMVGLPSLGVIPMSARATRSIGYRRTALDIPEAAGENSSALSIVSHTKPQSEMSEAYRALRTSILLSSSGASPKVIMVTSALPKEGKTTTAVNIATVLAQLGERVLLVDADLRRPNVGRQFGIKSSVGTTTLLTGASQLQDVIYPSADIPNLSIIPAGPIPPHPAELLGSEMMSSYIQQFRNSFDRVIIDTPPALSVTDAVVLSAQVDSVLVVIRSGQTRKEAMRHVCELLRQVKAKVAGVVMNGVDLQSPDQYYYRYGGKYSDNSYYRETNA